MGESSVDDDWVIVSPTSGPGTLVLLDGTGNDKNTNGNSILQNDAFRSERTFSGVTQTLSCILVCQKTARLLMLSTLLVQFLPSCVVIFP